MIFLRTILLSCLLLAFSSIPLDAEEIEKDPLVGISVSKAEIAKQLEDFKKQGKISDAEYLETQKLLNAMNESQISDINQKAIGMVRKDPDKAVALANMKKIDNQTQKDADQLLP
jgi:ABC-type dipeptide/oligopeptide/nickel transport system ATPase component